MSLSVMRVGGTGLLRPHALSFIYQNYHTRRVKRRGGFHQVQINLKIYHSLGSLPHTEVEGGEGVKQARAKKGTKIPPTGGVTMEG